MKLVAALLVVALVICGAEDVQQCKSATMKIVMKSHYNETGHWQSKVELFQGDRGVTKADTWLVDVQQRSSECEEDEYELHTTILLTAPSGVKNKTPYVSSGYEDVKGVGIVKKSTKVLSLADATSDCKKDGAFIMVVDSETKEKFVQTFTDDPAVFVGAVNNRDIWVGVQVVDGVWTSVQGVPLSEIPFMKWMDSRPKDGFCTVYAKPYTAHWDTKECTNPAHKLSYICERPKHK